MITARLVSMANQIALGVPDREHVTDQVTVHLRTFWAPAMIEELADHAATNPGFLQPEVVEALTHLRAKEPNDD